jgi:hypothetical protein
VRGNKCAGYSRCAIINALRGVGCTKVPWRREYGTGNFACGGQRKLHVRSRAAQSMIRRVQLIRRDALTSYLKDLATKVLN